MLVGEREPHLVLNLNPETAAERSRDLTPTVEGTAADALIANLTPFGDANELERAEHALRRGEPRARLHVVRLHGVV